MLNPGRAGSNAAAPAWHTLGRMTGIASRGKAPPRARYGRAMLRRWLLDPAITYLNHGAFGATPRAVLAAQTEWRLRLERQPVRFMTRELPGALRAAAAELAHFLGTSGANIGFVDNATTAVNAVLRGLDWHAGDEIALFRHAYPGVKNAVRALGARHGVVMREADFALPIGSEDRVVQAFEDALCARTRLAVVDHVSSQLAAVLPLAAIVERCHARGVPVLVDGAHAPGMLELELDSLGADWYAGNCHKWLYAPKGCAFLWTATGHLGATHPTVISNHWGEGYAREFDWMGTRDPSAWLSVSAALEFFRALGIADSRAYMRGLAREGTGLLAARWNAAPPAPWEMFATMATLPLPLGSGGTQAEAERVHDALIDVHGVEAPVFAFDGRLWLRISAQAYNEMSDFERLADAVDSLGRA